MIILFILKANNEMIGGGRKGKIFTMKHMKGLQKRGVFDRITGWGGWEEIGCKISIELLSY